MSTVFENPANGYREEVGIGSCYGVFFFGALYLAYKGLWKHVFVWLLVVIVPAVVLGGAVLIFSLPITMLLYTFMIQGILESVYLRRGWKELTEKPNMVYDPSSGGYREIPPPPKNPETKTCPFCAEEVKFEAIKCKHCQSDLPAPLAEKPSEHTPRVRT